MRMSPGEATTVRATGPGRDGPPRSAKRLYFFTSNRAKVSEARLYLNPLGYDVLWRRADLLEPQSDSLEDVVRVKLESAPPVKGLAMVEDSGFFVHSLNGFPGVYSSYAFKALGCEAIIRLLDDLPRGAHFEAVVGIRLGSKVRLFRGLERGSVSTRPRGHEGFGFDPVFVPEGSSLTMAEMPRTEKVKVSHRSKALASLAEWLEEESRRR